MSVKQAVEVFDLIGYCSLYYSAQDCPLSTLSCKHHIPVTKLNFCFWKTMSFVCLLFRLITK